MLGLPELCSLIHGFLFVCCFSLPDLCSSEGWLDVQAAGFEGESCLPR